MPRIFDESTGEWRQVSDEGVGDSLALDGWIDPVTGALGDRKNPSIMYNGQVMVPGGNGATAADIQRNYGITPIEQNGRLYLPQETWNQLAIQGGGGSGFIQKFLNGPGPVMALGAGIGALSGGFGLSSLLDNLPSFSSVPGLETATYGNAPGINLPGSGFMNVAADAAETGGGAGAINPQFFNQNTIVALEKAGEAGGLSGEALDSFVMQNAGQANQITMTALQKLGEAGGLTGAALDEFVTGGGAGAAGGYKMPSIPGGSSLASRLLGGDASLDDYLKAAGLGGGALMNYLQTKDQTSALKDIQNQQWDAGAWARDLNKGSYQPGFNLYDQPGYGDAFKRAADVSARAYSAKVGNPADNPGAQAGIMSDVWQGSYLPALTNYRGGLLQAGGQGLNTSATVGTQAAQGAGAGYDAAGYALGQATTPQGGLQQLLQDAGKYGYKLSY